MRSGRTDVRLRMSQISEARSATSLDPSRFPPLVKRLGEFFAYSGVSAYLVGGVVRDALLGRETSDIDLAVTGDALRVGQSIADLLGGHLVPLDEARRIARVVLPGDRGGTAIDISSAGDGIHTDLSRRDFTLDAMAVSLDGPWARDEPPVLVDPYNGAADADAGVIRAVSPTVFEDDPGRLLRGPRLAAQLRFDLSEATARAIRESAHLVTIASPERTRDELLKLLAEPGATASLRLMDDLGLLFEVIPELASARGVSQPREHHWDVLDHCIETAGQVERLMQRCLDPSDIVGLAPRFESMEKHFDEEVSDGHTRLTLLKLAGLLHDVGKPATKTVEASGRIRFLGHHTEGAQLTAEVLGRLRLGGRGIDLLTRMVEHHLRPSQMAQEGELPTPRAIFRYYRDLGDAGIDTLFLNLADYLAARGPELDEAKWSEHCGIIGYILEQGFAQESPGRMRKLIDGHDMMKLFRLEPGPRVGDLLELVREAQASGEVGTREEAISLVKTSMKSGAGGA